MHDVHTIISYCTLGSVYSWNFIICTMAHCSYTMIQTCMPLYITSAQQITDENLSATLIFPAGFDKKGIVQYIKSEFAKEYEKASRDGLLQQLKENALLRSICHVPINCAIICHMWRSDGSLPLDMTMTDIYTKIILHFMLRDFQKCFPQYGLESLNSFDAIPKDMQECLSLLCKFAYDAL